jgi:zinc transport system substrate-binding protein
MSFRSPWRALCLAILISAAAIAMVSHRAAFAADTPKVLTSIKPLHSLAANVMEGVGQPSLLMRATASPHTYTLRPSDARSLEQADIIFWIGPGYESFMAKAVRSLSRKARVVAIAKAPGITLLPTREGGVWAEEAEGHSHAHQHGEDETDMHLWLDPANAKAIVQTMVAALAQTDPGNAATYRANADRLLTRLDALDSDLRARLTPVAPKPFIVFHDAYQYLERRYGLTAAGSITVTPDRTPGPRRLSELRRTITERRAACVFSEPQFTSGLVTTVLEGTNARTAVLDPLGATAPEGKDGYFKLMHTLADSLSGCLLQAS